MYPCEVTGHFWCACAQHLALAIARFLQTLLILPSFFIVSPPWWYCLFYAECGSGGSVSPTANWHTVPC